jgi:hypothetical protein
MRWRAEVVLARDSCKMASLFHPYRDNASTTLTKMTSLINKVAVNLEPATTSLRKTLKPKEIKLSRIPSA